MSQNYPEIASSDTRSGLPTTWGLARASLLSSHSGSGRPSYATAGSVWYNSTSATLYLYNGSTDIPLLKPITDVFGTTGSVVFPNGYIRKWGVTSSMSSGGSYSYTFATAFPTGSLGANATLVGGPTATPLAASIVSLSTSAISICNASSVAGLTAFWEAWGY